VVLFFLNYYRDNKERINKEMEKRKWKIGNSLFPFPNSQFPLVSIVVTTKDKEKNIANCLKSIKNSTNPINSN